MFRLFVAIDDLKGERCPGEERCTILHPGLELEQELEEERARAIAEGVEVDQEEYEESIFTPTLDLEPSKACPTCYLFKTKPGNEPLAIQAALYWATEHDKKRRMGYTPKDRNELTPAQWAAWNGLDSGRSRWEEVLNRRLRQEAEQRALSNQGRGR